jgi:AbiV family abortive infection protein
VLLPHKLSICAAYNVVMAKLEEVEPLLQACLGNAERLVESAKAVVNVPGSNHIAYHLAVLALEEIGKAALIFQESLDPKPLPRNPDNEPRSPLDWMEDHERKLFWALWLPATDKTLDWRTIPEYMEFAKEIHLRRLHSLYFHPRFPDAQKKITTEDANKLIGLAELRLEMEKAKKYRELSDEDKADMQWFFAVSADPQIKTWIYSKTSLEKQAELANERNGWIKWLRGIVEESQRAAAELAKKEMERMKPEGGDRYDDKWLFKIRLKSWSHSIRANQLTKWNEGIEKIKLFTTDDRHELIVQFIMPKSITFQEIWQAGMQQCMIFVTALNIATSGFFWWYLPIFISKFHESIIDVESNSGIDMDRVPQLKIQWPHQALKEELLLQHLAIVFSFVAHANDAQREAYARYFRALAMMAKNDIFFQFEHHLVDEFISSFEMALQAYGDWDGDPATFDVRVTELFKDMTESEQLLGMISDMRALAATVKTRKIERPVTLEDAAKSKVIFDTYIVLKAVVFTREEMKKMTAGQAETSESE